MHNFVCLDNTNVHIAYCTLFNCDLVKYSITQSKNCLPRNFREYLTPFVNDLLLVTWPGVVTWLEERRVDGRQLQPLVPIERWSPLFYEDRFLDFSFDVGVLTGQNGGVVGFDVMACIVTMFMHCWGTSSHMFFQSGSKSSSCFPNIVVLAIFTLDMVYYTALFKFFRFVFDSHKNWRAYGKGWHRVVWKSGLISPKYHGYVAYLHWLSYHSPCLCCRSVWLF